MKLWLSKNPEVPLRDQLSTQIALAVAAGDLRPEDRLPSTQEVSRRFGVHANTVAAAYRELVKEGLLEFRSGNGYFVRNGEAEPGDARSVLLRKIDELVVWARSQGIDTAEIAEYFGRSSDRASLGVLLVESDLGLREIIRFELERAGLSVMGVSTEEFSSNGPFDFAAVVAMFDERPKLEPLLDDGVRCVYLAGRSVADTMAGESRPGPNDMVGVVSGWDGFLTLARIMLLAAKVEPGQLVVRSTRDPGWRRAIRGLAFAICDPLTATLLPEGLPSRTFPIVSDDSINEIKALLS